MDVKWTNAQSDAINAVNSSIVVSAAAGSGKTAVLVERVLTLITRKENPVDIDKLIIVTFTNAAAAEMRSRISKRLNDELSVNPNDSNLLRQLSLLPNAKISTIDSFCINLVRENFFNLDIEQDFTVMDESEQTLIAKETCDEIIGELYESGDEGFKSLVETLSSTKSDSKLAETIISVHRYIMSQAFPFDWLDRACEIYNPDISIDASFVKEYVFNELKDVFNLCLELVDESRKSLIEDDLMYDKYYDMLTSHKDMFSQALDTVEHGGWDEVKTVTDAIRFDRIPFKPGYTSPSKLIVAGNRDKYKAMTEKACELLSMTGSEFEEDNRYLYPIIKRLADIIKDFHNRMSLQKNELNSYSFADIERFALELLYDKDENGQIIKTPLALDYESTYYEVLVDEYQDTNAAQDALFDLLSGDRGLFVVGDVKQSIYKFRLAMPQIFNSRKNNAVPYDEKSESINKRIILDSNFRSRKGICDYTNFVFSHIMSSKVGEMEYTPEEYLNCGAKYDENGLPCVQINLAETPDDVDADEYEAHQVAKLILKKIESREQIQGKDGLRDVSFGDFAVLFRAPKNRMPVFSRVFAEYSIPTVSNNKVNLFDNNEVSILLSLIRVIDNPVQDIPLLATLMSSFYGYTPDDIAQARLSFKASNLYSSIAQAPQTFGAFLSDLERYREYASSMSVEGLLMQIISETSYLSVISAMGNHEQRRLNVLKLVEIAKRFDSGQNVGLTAFVRYIDSIIDSRLGVESASVSNSGDNSVALMSVHQSKGLEFPICILAGSGHRYNSEDRKQLVQLNDEMGIGLKMYNGELLYRYNTLQYNVINDKNIYASMSENLRVLYVAITRAREQFICFFSDKNIERHIDNLSKKIINGKIYPSVAKSIICDGDFLLLCALLHKDADMLRSYCENPVEVDFTADFDMTVALCDGMEVQEQAQAQCAEPCESDLKEISEKLSFSYDRLELAGFASKRTASSLDDKEHSFEFFAKSKPAFLNSTGLTPAQRGTAMHAFMQFCIYENAKSDLEKEISRLEADSFITKEQADSLDRERLSTLFTSDFANRMFNADRIYREIKVSSFVDVSELEDTELNDKVLVQGIADCVFEENGELVLVDYKTDRVDSEEELMDRYKNQLAFYKKSISKTLKKPVKEVLLYSFHLNKICIYK